MEHSKIEIARLFSNGNFESVFPYLSESVEWNVIGENVFKGKTNVIKSCEQTSKYFNSVETVFKTNDIIESGNKVIIRGTGEFFRDGKRLNLISACDVYEFNENNVLQKILSYCIPSNE